MLSLPSDRLDPSSAVAIGKAETFTRRLRDGEDALGAALPGIAATRSGWLVRSPVSTDAATMLRDLGFDLLTLGADDYSTLDGNIGGFVDTTLAVQVALDDAGTMPAMVMSGAGELLVGDEDIDPTAAAVRILAELLTTRRELGALQRRSVVLATPALAIPDPAVAGRWQDWPAAVPDLRLTPLSALASSTDTMLVEGQPQTISLPARRRPGPRGTPRTRRVDGRLRRERRLDAPRRQRAPAVAGRARRAAVDRSVTMRRSTPRWPGSRRRPTPCATRSCRRNRSTSR